MGLYDFRCTITGISLKGTDAVLVGLLPADGGYRPITLGIAGTYNRLGSIDHIEEDLNTELVLTYFRDRARSGEFVLDPDYARDYGNPPNDIECLLRYFERNVSDSSEEYPAATLFGKRIFSTLIAKPVWTALTAPTPREGAPETWFEQLFGESSIAGAIYRNRVPELAKHLRELSSVNAFLVARGLTWNLPDDEEIGEQHDHDEQWEFLNAARSTFHDVPMLLTAFDDYAEEVDLRS